MPNIRESFDAGAGAIRPTEIGVDAQASAARRIGSFFNQQGGMTEEVGAQTERTLAGLGREAGSTIQTVGDVAERYVTNKEISTGAAAWAKSNAAWIDDWNKRSGAADANDPTVAPKFRDELEQHLEEFRDAFHTTGGQQWAESHIDAFRQHMFQKTAADMSRRAYEATKINVAETVNSLSSMVHGDPSSLDYALNTIDSSLKAIVGSSPNLSGTDAGSVLTALSHTAKEQVTQYAARGYIQKTGQVPSWATDPKYAKYINGTELKQFEQQARIEQRLARSEERSNREEQQRANRDDFNKKMNALEAATMPQNVGDTPRLPADYWQQMRTLSTHPGAALDPGRYATMVRNGEAVTDRMNKPEPPGPASHTATMELLDRIRSTDTTTRLTDNAPIYDAYQQGRLNNADFNFLQREFTNLRSPEGQALGDDRKMFMSRYTRMIDGGMTDAQTPSLLGQQELYRFEMDARRQEQVLRQKGLDPHLVYDPRSEYFFGSPENLAKYHVSLHEANDYKRIFESMDRSGAPAPAAAPAANPAAAAPPRVTTRAEFDRLPSGARYLGADGVTYRKP